MKKTLFKVINFSFCLLLLFAITLSFLSGCKEESDNLERNKFNYTFIQVGFSHISYADSMNKLNDLFLGIKSSQRTLPEDDVTLELYFGGNFNESLDVERMVGYNVDKVDIYVYNEDVGDKVFIKQTEEPLVSEKYRVNVEYYKTGDLFINHYNHNEKITVPSELFEGVTGKIRIDICGVNKNEENSEYKPLLSGVLYYKMLENNKVMLSEFEGDYVDWISSKI